VAAAAAAILELDDKILLARRAQEPGLGLLDLPGGFIEPDETAEQGLRRELGEELNLRPANLRYLCSLPNRYPWGGIEYRSLDLFFVARLESLTDLRPSSEIAAVELISPESINFQEMAFESIRRGLEFYLRTL
jgi:ADP-ribose pyrophosphatase YjhB (NUDIX family)